MPEFVENVENGFNRYGVAVFGFGRAGHVHVGNLLLNSRACLHYIVEIGAGVKQAREFVAKHQLNVRIIDDAKDEDNVFNDNRVDVVVVAVPTIEHERIICKSFQHNKAVFCEKPISQKSDTTRACYEAADKAQLPLMCSFNRRFDPSFRSLQQKVKSGQIGKLHVIKTCSRDGQVPSAEYLKIAGGIFQDCAVHDFDLIMWIVGERPCVVHTLAHSHLPHVAAVDDVDTVVMTMKFPSGALAVIDLSRNAIYGFDQRAEVFGTNGMLISENQRPTELVSYMQTETTRNPIKYSFPQRYAEAYVGALEHFFNVLEGKECLEVSKDDAISVNIVAAACEESYRSGQPVYVKYD
jgi:myo-inositol 2-dehydrogenase/D-chiro-inositol 1-dehydrogenase